MSTLGVKSLKNMPIQKLPFKGYIYAAGIIDIITIFVIVITHSDLPPVAPLFYGLPVGVSQLVNSWGLTIAPLSALLITVINVFLAIYLKDNFLKKVFVIASFFISILSLVTVVKIILLIGFW